MRAWAIAKSPLIRGLDLLLPPRCFGCGATLPDQGFLCGGCWSALTFITEPCCALCGFPFDYAVEGQSLCGRCVAKPPRFDGAAAALVYDDKSRALVLAFKRGDRTELAAPLARFMARAGAGALDTADLILPVPLHRGRLFARRFNQSALLAKALAGYTGVDWSADLLERRRATRSQGGLSRSERSRNVRGAFRARRRVDDLRIVLVDDVMTTGATAEACAGALRRAGAAHIFVLTLTRVVTPAQSPV